jgi:hypothetical protein
METIMNTEISAKFAAFTAALTMTGLIIAGLAYMFNVPVAQATPGIADSGQRPQCGWLGRHCRMPALRSIRFNPN